MKRAAFKADGLLLLAAVIWGGAFAAQRVAMQHVGPLTFNGVRFALGALTLVPIVYIRRNAAQGRAQLYLLGGVGAGLVLFVGATLQQVGLVYTTAGKAGFITGLYVVLVPILGLFIGQRAAVPTWIGAALAVAGLYLLSVTAGLTLERGDGLVLGCAVVWAVYILLVGWLSPRMEPVRFAVVQYAVVAAISLLGAAVTEPMHAEGLRAAGGAILYGGVLSVGVAYTLQMVGQRIAPPAHAGLLLSLEAVFAALAGWLLLAETLAGRQLVGCGLMLAGIVVSQVRRRTASVRVGGGRG